MWLEGLGRDLRLALRLVRRSPGFAAVAIVTLALGLGCNLAIFTLVDAVALRLLPVAHADQLVQLDWTAQRWSSGHTWGTRFRDAQGRRVTTVFSYDQFKRWTSAGGAVSGALAFHPLSVLYVRRLEPGASGMASSAAGSLVSGNYFQMLGLNPALGRLIEPADMAAGAAPVAVLRYGYWLRQFGGERGVVGQTIEINGLPARIVGVTPPGFAGLELGRVPDIFLPLEAIRSPVMASITGEGSWDGSLAVAPNFLSNPRNWFVEVVARRQPSASVAQVRAQLAVSFANAAVAIPQGRRVIPRDKPLLVVASAGSGVNNLGTNFTLPLELLAALTGLILLVVCVNLANLLLARAAVRKQELAIRIAIGAGRAALLRQLLAEAFVLAGLGAVASQPLGLAAGQLLEHLVLPPRVGGAVHWDLAALAVAAGLAVAAALLMGAIPAWQASRREGLAHQLRQPRWRKGLIIAQIALCVAVVASAALFARTLRNFQAAPTGLEAHNVVILDLDPGLAGYHDSRLAGFIRQVLARLRALPGVQAAAASGDVPGGQNSDSTDSIATTPRRAPDSPQTAYNVVTPGFFGTYHLPLIAGRDFTAADDATAPPVAIVDQAMARRFHGLPVGQKLYWFRRGQYQMLTVIGVAADSVYNGVRQASMPVLYIPFAQQYSRAYALTFEVRSARPLAALAPALRRAVAAVDVNVPVLRLETQAEAMAASYRTQTTLAAIALPLAALALLLACLGALCGLPLAWLAGRAAANVLFGVGAADPASWAGTIALLLAVAAAAAVLPARRAASVDVALALREP
ncbi:MAG: ABC transporter permease [Terriglobales bacterium]